MKKYSKIISKRAAKNIKTCAAAISLLTLVSTGTSFAFTTYNGYQDVPPLKVKSVSLETRLQYQPSSAMTDPCLSMLKTFRKTSSKSVIDRNQRSAGQVAALGLIFGVRYALSPAGSNAAFEDNADDISQGNFDVWHQNGSSVTQDNRSAQTISAYRTCQKNQALSALSEF